jgi:8-oxo-dGTP diphosphatase
MQHRISAGVIIEHDGKVLLVRHVKPGAYDFWVCPGGGVKGSESLEEAAVREAREEAGVDVELGKLIYIEEFFNPDCRHIKFWFTANVVGGQLDWSHPEAIAEYITQAAWHSLSGLDRITVFPDLLSSRYATDRDAGFPSPVRLPLREMAFW